MSARRTTIRGFRRLKTLKDTSEYELRGNGLRVLHIRVPGSGTVTSNLVYLVGSRHEERGRTGLAHMLEHMLFKPVHDGNGKKVREQGHKVLEDAGALMNATTWLDRTNYFFTVPVAYFEKALAVEAQRMRHLLFEEKEFQPERANVISEYEMHAGIPSDALMTAVTEAAFVSHGYGHETIGHKPDLLRMTLSSLRAFYDTYYWPNNAMLTIVGDIPLSDALRAVQKIFGSIPRSPCPIPEQGVVEPAQEGERRVEVARESPLNISALAYKVPPTREYDTAVLAVIAAYLTDGPQSELDEKLVDTHKASSVEATIYPTHDTGLFVITAQITTSSSHEEVERVIDRELARLSEKSLSARRLAELKTKIIADETYGRDGTIAISGALTECIALGDWTRFYTFADDVEKVTVRDIQRAAQKYFQKNNRVVGMFIGQKKKK